MKVNSGHDKEFLTLAGGTQAGTSGTATSTTATSLTNTGASWSTNQWAGKFVVAGTAYGVIVSNTATVLTIDRWYAPATPTGSPIASCTSARRSTSHITCRPCAPSAILTPISAVRCATEYAVTAYKPTADSTSAIAAKMANIDPNTRKGHRCCASVWSIVRIPKSGRSGSIARISSRTRAVMRPGSPAARTMSVRFR